MDIQTRQLNNNTVQKCCVCDKTMRIINEATILNKYRIKYYHCNDCGFMRTEQPYWLEEAYSGAIAASDTGQISRNIHVSRTLSSLLFLALSERGDGRWLDFAGGYGMLSRMMRDKGYNFYWSDKYASNIFAQGFEHSVGDNYAGVTAIEVLEHTEDPMAFLSEMALFSPDRTVIFTTELYGDTPPKPENWWYYGLNTGQHVSFFQQRTLETIARRIGVKYERAGLLHIFSDQLPSRQLLRLAGGRVSILVDFFARRRLRSNVITDHHLIVARQQDRVASNKPAMKSLEVRS